MMNCPLSLRLRVVDVYSQASDNTENFWNLVKSDPDDVTLFIKHTSVIEKGLDAYRAWCSRNGITEYKLEGVKDMWVEAGFYFNYKITFSKQCDARKFRIHHRCYP